MIECDRHATVSAHDARIHLPRLDPRCSASHCATRQMMRAVLAEATFRTRQDSRCRRSLHARSGRRDSRTSGRSQAQPMGKGGVIRRSLRPPAWFRTQKSADFPGQAWLEDARLRRLRDFQDSLPTTRMQSPNVRSSQPQADTHEQ